MAMKEMDEGSVQYFRCLADDLYTIALLLDRCDEQELATAHLELAFGVQKEIAAAGYKVFLLDKELAELEAERVEWFG